jgi:plastocyanin domain-containing protein
VTSVAAVIVGGVLAIMAWELWYFRGRRLRPAAEDQAKPGTQEIRIALQGGFDPDLVIVEAGRQIRMEMFRGEVDPQSERLAFDTIKVTKTLAEFTHVPVEFILGEPGDYRFSCGTCYGHIVAQVGGDAARGNLGRGHLKHG